MSIVIMKRNLYAFTLKETFTKEHLLTECAYSLVLNNLRARGTILYCVFERKGKGGRKARLHCHGVIEFDKIPRLTTLCPPTFSTKFEKIYDEDGWKKYINKYNKPEPIKNFDDISEQVDAPFQEHYMYEDHSELVRIMRENLI